MAKFQVSPSFLIGHVYYYGEVFEKILGEVRAALTDPVKSAYDKNLKPTLHSDYNCQPVDPLRCIYNAVTRKMKYAPGRVLNKDQCVTPLQAVQAMTINAAWQCHMEDIVGSIEVGKMADFVILEQDPVDPKTDPEQIINIKISETWMDGKPTF
jgi:predicted amidohydrolase YtcJ